MSTILGLDSGPTPIGWVLVYRENKEIIKTGVRIFPEGVENYGTSGQQKSKNAARRIARGKRKQYKRFRMRRDNLVWRLKQVNMFPDDEQGRNKYFQIDPYVVRATGLDKKLSLLEFGRALYHINERRGFKSNRKTGANEDSKIFQSKKNMIGITDTEKAIREGWFRTLGE